MDEMSDMDDMDEILESVSSKRGCFPKQLQKHLTNMGGYPVDEEGKLVWVNEMGEVKRVKIDPIVGLPVDNQGCHLIIEGGKILKIYPSGLLGGGEGKFVFED